ncbi:GbsR/MarR family transcriptional regulator [Pseudooceanicola sediminis]|uniref:GbsR/MarR family transcriptional regulator n=1 Tax=Pseudooceanicola sediminis TaxID=2211117 RepID=UPI0018F5F057|nr:transcriptional regulator [Pseudooceanicola sediminis]|tara:strand:+ start:44578 stop:45084 length:507 start_codon:yes stop_codon:yes gene_type:complete
MSENPINRFIETMGMLSQGDGGTRISGQILAYLLTEGEPRTLQQMTTALRISKASASTNARMLELHGLVHRVSHLGSRQDAWETVPDPHYQLLTRLIDRFRRNYLVIEDIAASFPSDRADARERVENFNKFYSQSADFFEEWLSHLSDETAVQSGGGHPQHPSRTSED